MDNVPDEDTGMWMVDRPEERISEIIPLNTIYRAAHLIPFYAQNPVPQGVTAGNSLNAYDRFYVNKFIDHHAFEILS